MEKKVELLALAIIAIIAISSVFTVAFLLPSGNGIDTPPGMTTTPLETTTPPPGTTTTLPETTTTPPKEGEVKWLVDPGDIRSGGPPKDGIPSIDQPIFVEPSEADFITDSDNVIGVSYNGITKAYPMMILVWHELVNDWFGDIPLTVSYCPLCWSSITFVRVVDGKTVEFGTSGRLFNSDLVMYDRQSGQNHLTSIGRDLKDAGNLWSQFLGQAIVGPLAGYKLIKVPTDVMPWGDWQRLHPDTLILSTDTGYNRAYGADPYGSYYTSPTIWFPVTNEDDRLFEKAVIFGVEYDDQQKAYPVQPVDENGVLNDVFQDRGIVLFKVGSMAIRGFESDVNDMRLTFEIKDGQFVDKETNSIWNEQGVAIEGSLKDTTLGRVQNGHIAFWFAWAAFYPTTEVFE